MTMDVANGGVSDEELNQLEEIILSKVQQRTPSRMNEETYILKAFRHYDLNGSGWCDIVNFKKALLPFSSGISDQDFQAIFMRYAPDGNLYYKAFIPDFVQGVRRQLGASQEYGNDFVETVEDTLLRIKQYLYSQGPRGIIMLAAAFRDADPGNARSMTFETFANVMLDYFQNTECVLQEEHLEQIFQVFRQMYAPNQLAYDEFFLALKEEPTPERRASVREAFRLLDSHSEGLVELQAMIRAFNATRHPQVSEGVREPEEVKDEFATTLKELVAFRRGQRSYPTNLVAWEEFEDYYKFTNGCYESDMHFCGTMQRVWDLDKKPQASVEARHHLAAPAAGIPPKSRAGLHHWQTDTLPKSHQYSVPTTVKLEDALLRVRRHTHKHGIRFAVDVVKHFYTADDDVDDMIDIYEFRRACQVSGISFSTQEEARIFEVCSANGDNRMMQTMGGTIKGKIEVPRFLQMLQGPIPPDRRILVEAAWRSLGGDPHDEASVVSPSVLKDAFACEAHPMVARGELDPEFVLCEFLDTFSLLAHVRGGCQNGMVAFSDFYAYYEVVSSSIENDHFFDLLMHRLWSLPLPGDATEDDGRVPRSPRSPRKEEVASPMAEPRPPTHSGATAYTTAPVPAEQTHRRFLRKEPAAPMGAPPGMSGYPGLPSQPAMGFSPITKSSIVFDEIDKSELGQVILHLRQSLSARGLRGWRALVSKFEQYDHRKNGGIMRTDFERMHRTLGLGLAPEERDALFKNLSAGRRDGAMQYNQCLARLKGQLPERREALVRRLFEYVADEGGLAKVQDLQAIFDPRNTPTCMLGKKDANTVMQEFCENTEYFLDPRGITYEAFVDFFCMISAINEEEDDFRLMCTAAFGLPQQLGR